MGLPLGLRRGAVVAVALAAFTVPGASAWAAAPSPVPTVPSESEVSRAKDAAAAVAEEVAEITARVERAEARLQALQREVSEAVSAQEEAEAQLADAEDAVRRATVDLAAAQRARDAADRALSGRAALMYMQGSDLQNLTTLLVSPPNVMADLSLVLDDNAREVRQGLDVATSAAVDAAFRERELTRARDTQAAAVEEAAASRAGAEAKAEKAGEEAAELGEQQEELTARLDELEEGAADLAGLREAAASLGRSGLLGLQAAGSLGTGPKAAQEIARSKMASYGWDDAEFTCLVALWYAESAWSWSATNPSSGAYGIPQSLPGWKMASAGSDWLTNPATQITWGMGYIEDVYGSPCTAYEKFLSRSPHWY
ncbi:hypothetical protein GCM10023168_17920 [Fodinibacter luteus]|uniref:Lytic transglycosylase domain-containing protein n=1 Tax=Fodinibacter luteus TaxID=552064 RepID=A0ABP8KEF2_9MICO